MSRAMWVLPLLVWGACVEPEDQLVELDDIGQACLGDMEGPEIELTADEAVTVVVTLEGCASGCAGDIEATCTASVDDGVISVSASASYTTPGGTATCPAVCVFVQAECDTEALPAGSYTLEYGGDSDTFDVPAKAASVCAGTYN